MVSKLSKASLSGIHLDITAVFHTGVICQWLVVAKKLQRQLAIILKPLQQLESWASFTLIQGSVNELTIDDSSQEIKTITLATRQFQQQINDNAASDIASDKSIRESTLLDQETSIRSRAFFDNKLQALFKEDDAQGAVLMIQFKAIELLQNLYGYPQAISLLLTLIQVTKQRLQDLPGYFLAQHSVDELSVLLPNIATRDAEKLAELLLKNLQTVVTAVGINSEEFVHIGMRYFGAEQIPYQIMSEADMALRAAQLQGPSQCFMFEADELALVKAK